MSFNGVRHRAGRSFLTFLSITMAVAFLGYVLLGDALAAHVATQHPSSTPALTVPTASDIPAGPPLIWVVTISLGVCVCGIANAMLMSVTERFREIATLKCLGAIDSVVIRVYLLEALGQGLVGAIFGNLVGILLALVVGWLTYGSRLGFALPWISLLTTSAWCLLTGISLAVLGALYPTLLAAKMAPVAAMRAKF